MYELIYQGETIGVYNSEAEAIKYIEDNENVCQFIRKEKIRDNLKRIDFGGYRRYYYIRRSKNV